MSLQKICRASLTAALLALSGCGALPTDGSSQEPLSFAVIGDLGYLPQYEPQLDRVLAELNAARLAFVVHLGDLATPRYACTDEVRAKRLAQFEASAHPLVFTPGDNDWTDCHEGPGVKGFDPDERLANLRQVFFAGPKTLGRRTFPLARQSDASDPATARYRENARWSMGGVLFVTLHIVGSNNNRGRTPAADAEYADRTQANIKWLREAFQRARAENARAVMILTQANIFFDGSRGKEPDPSGFAELRTVLEREVIDFGRPVVFFHGDTHNYRIDKPLGRRTGKQPLPSLENFTRVEGFGQPNHHWVHVTAERDDPTVFTFRQRIVPGNVVDRRSTAQ